MHKLKSPEGKTSRAVKINKRKSYFFFFLAVFFLAVFFLAI
jgi:hypothetical protein